MAEHSRSERTEKPTARRLQKARERGQQPRSPEIPGLMVLAAFLIFGHWLGASWLARLQGFLAAALGTLARPELDPLRAVSLINDTTRATGMLLAPPLALFACAAVAGNLMQGPPPLSLYPLRPRWERLAPMTNLRRVFSPTQGVEGAKLLLKLALYTWVAWSAVSQTLGSLAFEAGGAAGVLRLLAATSGKVIFRVTLLTAGLALLDLLFRRWEHARSLRMTKREVRDERKELEGDPLIRARIRSRHMSLARTRMMADVERATVVVTNPTHVAVALRYVQGETAVPKLLAKGRGKIAERIRAIAGERGIPIVEDPPLARALWRSVPVGGEIPAALFRAVAEVLALVMGGRRRRPAGAEVLA